MKWDGVLSLGKSEQAQGCARRSILLHKSRASGCPTIWMQGIGNAAVVLQRFTQAGRCSRCQ